MMIHLTIRQLTVLHGIIEFYQSEQSFATDGVHCADVEAIRSDLIEQASEEGIAIPSTMYG
jgi:hypothetical protein